MRPDLGSSSGGAFILSGSTFATLPGYRGAEGTVYKGINDAGQLVGSYWVNSNQMHGFILTGSNFVSIDYPGANRTWANGINDAGQVVGMYADSSGIHGFFFSESTYTSIDYPGAVDIEPQGVNDAGQVVGMYRVSGITYHSFMATPVPIPPSVWLLGSGLIGLVGLRRKFFRK
jgi:uncharacterized membrane protein